MHAIETDLRALIAKHAISAEITPAQIARLAQMIDEFPGEIITFDFSSKGPATVPAAREIAQGRFLLRADGTIVTDQHTGLEWARSTAPEQLDWKAAAAWCAELRLGGHSDWRLPTRKELLSLVDDTRHHPAIDAEAFPDTKTDDWYWTGTPAACSPDDYAWVVGFAYGGSSWGRHGLQCYVRAVRASQ